MRKHTLFAFILSVVGCGGQLDAPLDDTAAFTVGGTRPAPSIVQWQFRGCLTPNQRSGLIQALSQIHAAKSPGLYGEVGLSQCYSDGDERGALFLPNTTSAARTAAVAQIAIRPLQRQYAFQVTRYAINVIGNAMTATPERFDSAGNLSPTGRYETAGWGYNLANHFVARHIIDTQTTATVDAGDNELIVLSSNGGLMGTYTGPFSYVNPPSSTDPYQQLEIIATQPYIKRNLIHPVINAGNFLLAFYLDPSLSGWPMPFDLITYDDAYDVTVSGGDLIM